MSFQNRDTIIVVTGLQRSGTALMMQILAAAGLPMLVDDVRKADEYNRNGYYEYSKVSAMKLDQSILKDAVGKCLKVYAAYIPNLPKKYNYKFIIMDRPMSALFPSLQRKYNRRDDFLEATKINQLESVFEKSIHHISKLPNAEFVSIGFDELIDHPATEISKLEKLLAVDLQPFNLNQIVEPNLRSKKGVVNLIKTDRAPENIYQLIEKYTKDKVFCEIGIGEGDNLNKVNNAARKFGIEKALYGYRRCKEKYPDIELYHGDALELIPKHAFEVCYLWITYPANQLIVTKVFENYPNCIVIMGINYFYHLEKNDPKYVKYLDLYGDKASAENWNEAFDEHKKLLIAAGYNVELTAIESETKELFSVAIITK